MYYSGKNKSSWLRGARLRIGLAFSIDGLNWTKYDRNPILDVGGPTEWDSAGVYCPVVWQEDETWNMVFTGCNTEDPPQYQVGHATSRDGLLWTKSKDNPSFCDVSLGKNRSGLPETEGWGLLKSGSKYLLLYNTVTIRPRQVYVAESTDLVKWMPSSSRPLIPSEGAPSELGYMKYCAWPHQTGSRILVFAATSNENYTSSAIGVWKIRDFSVDGKREFVGYLMRSGAEWCAAELDTPLTVAELMHSDGEVRVYYGGRGANNKWCEGLAFTEL
jgi:predicted GH43/DUF377 family glycosyl hydrolase